MPPQSIAIRSGVLSLLAPEVPQRGARNQWHRRHPYLTAVRRAADVGVLRAGGTGAFGSGLGVNRARGDMGTCGTCRPVFRRVLSYVSCHRPSRCVRLPPAGPRWSYDRSDRLSPRGGTVAGIVDSGRTASIVAPTDCPLLQGCQLLPARLCAAGPCPRGTAGLSRAQPEGAVELLVSALPADRSGEEPAIAARDSHERLLKRGVGSGRHDRNSAWPRHPLH